MNTLLPFFLSIAVPFLFAASTASAHPGSGIVVDVQGNVYFSHFEHGVGKIDPHGKVS
jgi:hypothetical protein